MTDIKPTIPNATGAIIDGTATPVPTPATIPDDIATTPAPDSTNANNETGEIKKVRAKRPPKNQTSDTASTNTDTPTADNADTTKTTTETETKTADIVQADTTPTPTAGFGVVGVSTATGVTDTAQTQPTSLVVGRNLVNTEFDDYNGGDSTEIAELITTNRYEVLREQLTSNVIRDELAKYLPADRVDFAVGNMLSLLLDMPSIQKATPQSLINVMLQASRFNLPLDSINQFAYVIVYGDKARLSLSPAGVRALMLSGGHIKRVECYAIDNNELQQLTTRDGFMQFYNNRIQNPADIKDSYIKDHEIAGFMAVAIPRDPNDPLMTEFMSALELEQHRLKYANSKNNRLWDTEYRKMREKTVLHALYSRKVMAYLQAKQNTTLLQISNEFLAKNAKIVQPLSQILPSHIPSVPALNEQGDVIDEVGSVAGNEPATTNAYAGNNANANANAYAGDNGQGQEHANPTPVEQSPQPQPARQPQDISQDPTRFEKLCGLVLTGQYPIDKALNPAYVILSEMQHAELTNRYYAQVNAQAQFVQSQSE